MVGNHPESRHGGSSPRKETPPWSLLTQWCESDHSCPRQLPRYRPGLCLHPSLNGVPPTRSEASSASELNCNDWSRKAQRGRTANVFHQSLPLGALWHRGWQNLWCRSTEFPLEGPDSTASFTLTLRRRRIDIGSPISTHAGPDRQNSPWYNVADIDRMGTPLEFTVHHLSCQLPLHEVQPLLKEVLLRTAPKRATDVRVRMHSLRMHCPDGGRPASRRVGTC